MGLAERRDRRRAARKFLLGISGARRIQKLLFGIIGQKIRKDLRRAFGVRKGKKRAQTLFGIVRKRLGHKKSPVLAKALFYGIRCRFSVLFFHVACAVIKHNFSFLSCPAEYEFLSYYDTTK